MNESPKAIEFAVVSHAARLRETALSVLFALPSLHLNAPARIRSCS